MKRSITILVLLAALLLGTSLAAGAQEPVVRAIFFYSPTCPHCHTVINEIFPPLVEEYGDQVEILSVDVTTAEGQAFYQSAIDAYAVPENRLGVPALIVGDLFMVGSGEIPQFFPQIIEEALATGGIAYPVLEGIDQAVSQFPNYVDVGAEGLLGQTIGDQIEGNFIGNAIAIVLIIGMAFSLFRVGSDLNRTRKTSRYKKQKHQYKAESGWRRWATPLIALAGIGVAGYLTYISATGAETVCGPLGNCDAVQGSEYATFLGIPVAVLGVLGYVGILVCWVVAQLSEGQLARYATLLLMALAFVGVVFSLYLTILEPFVIGAICTWCLVSAILMTALMWLALPSTKEALQKTPA